MRRASFVFSLFALLAVSGFAADPTCPGPIVPPSSRLLYLGPITAEYSDDLPMRARLVDESAAPIAGRTLTFAFGGETHNAVTGPDGIASTTFTVAATPGSVPLLISDGSTQTTATILVDRDKTNLALAGAMLLPTGNVTLSARLTHGGADHPPLPIANRPIDFTFASHAATGVSDANGVASVTIAISDAEAGVATATARFSGDAFYRESQDSRATFAFEQSGFVIWGGNAAKPAVGQTVNFWGDQWVRQVIGGDYDANASFKGYGLVNATGDGWDSKPGNPPPPLTLARYIGAIVSTSIKKSGDTISGNSVAQVILEVQPGYDSDPGHPG